MSKITKERQYLYHIDDSSFPVAFDECGNYVVVNLNEGGAVYFWDHELPDERFKLADDVAIFLDTLESFDTSKIELEEGQEGEVWVNPKYKELLKKYGLK